MRLKSVLAGMLWLSSSVEVHGQQSGEAVAITARRLIDGAGRTLDNATVVVEGNRITSVGTIPSSFRGKRVDLGDATLMPGLIDVHAHVAWYFNAQERYHTNSDGETPAQGALAMAANAYQTLLSGVTTLQSGIPANVTFAADRANIGIAGLQRPNLVGPVPELNCQPNSGGAPPQERRQLMNCYDASAFALPDQFTFGDAGRNILRGPDYKNTDLAFMKSIPFRSTRVQLRAEVFNLFNRANFGNPNTTFGAAAFGRITTLATGATMRRIQLGAKFSF